MRYKLLFVDDNLTSLTLAKNAIAPYHDAVPCPSGAQAVRIAEKLAPDALFLDIEMPDMDGFQTLSALRAAGITAPAWFLSGSEDEGTRARAEAAGARGLLGKPVSAAALLAALEAEL